MNFTRLLYYLFIFNFSFLLFSCNGSEEKSSKSEKNASYYFNEAVKYKDNGNYTLALENINEAIHMDSTLNDYYEIRSEIYFALSDTIHANEDFNFILSTDTSDIEKDNHLRKMIKWNNHIGNKEKALELIEKEISLFKSDDKKHEEVISFVINEFISIGDETSAVKLCEKTIKTNPKYSFPHKYLAEIDLTKKNWKYAIKHYNKYCNLNEYDCVALNNLGYCYLQVNDKTNAKKYYKLSADKGNNEGCENYRELSATIKYTTHSECCDGSTSNSTGKGTCSHHGGVCKIIKTPYKEYSISCK